MANDMVSQHLCTNVIPFPVRSTEHDADEAPSSYCTDEDATVHSAGWIGNIWTSMATMAKIMIDREEVKAGDAYLLYLSEDGSVFLLAAASDKPEHSGARAIVGVTKHSSIERIALRLQEAVAQVA